MGTPSIQDFKSIIIEACKQLKARRVEFYLINQLFRSGTSIGAQSKADFISKLSIAYKEARECKFWLNLISDSEDNLELEISRLINLNVELIKLLTAIIKTTKDRYSKRRIN